MNNLNPEQVNQLLKFAIGGYWSALAEKLQNCEFVTTETKQLLDQQLNYQIELQNLHRDEELNDASPHTIADYLKTKKENEQLTQELTTEKETTQQALRRGEEWHERQKAEIIAEWKQKLTTYRNQRKTSLQAEITLIKEVLHE